MEHRSLIKKAHARMKNKDHYQVLEVGRDASTELIRDVYFKLAKIYHPDRCAALGLSDLVPVAEEVFRRVNEAHSILSNPETRKAYEAENEGGGESEEARRALEAEFAFQKGVVLFRKKAYAEALREFEEACRLNDKEAEHLAWLAWTRFCDPKSDRVAILPRVKEQLLQATRIAPKNPTCHYFLGEVHLALGDERRAKISFAHTVELQEGHVEANRHLRIMQMRKDKKEKEESKGIFGRFKKK
jgi:tetratricopeptide (TPR) repeat protein